MVMVLMTVDVPKLFVDGLAMLAAAAAAGCYFRWRENIASASARLTRHASRWLPSFLPPGPWIHPGPWRFVVAFIAFGLAAIAFGFLFVCVGDFSRPGAKVRLAFSAPARRDAYGGVFIMAMSLFFIAYGLHHIVRRQEWALWNQWLHRTDRPLGEPFPARRVADHAVNYKWVIGMVLVGIWYTSLGSVLLWVALALLGAR
jgi:hypothetical protein